MPNIGSSPPTTVSGSIASIVNPLDLLTLVPETAYPTTNFDKIVRSVSGSTTIFNYTLLGVDLFQITVDNETGDFTLQIVEFNILLTEDDFEVLLEDGDSVLLEG